MSTKSKAYKAAAELVDKSRLYTPLEASKLAKDLLQELRRYRRRRLPPGR